MSTEKYTISGSQLVDKIKQLIHEGNIRRVRVLHEGRTVLEIPSYLWRWCCSDYTHDSPSPGCPGGLRGTGHRMHD